MKCNTEKMRVCIGPIFLLIWVTAVAAYNNETQQLEVDTFRRDLIRINAELVLRLDIDSTMRNPEVRRQALVMIIDDYSDFGDKFDAKFPATREQYLDPLNPLWAWARVEEPIQRIDGLYKTFRRMQQISKESHFSNDENTWKNFSDTILNDPKLTVANTMIEIFNLIINEELFKSAYKVPR